MSRRLRLQLLATVATLALAGGVTVIALAAQGPSEPPSIELDAGGPLFTLQGMQPGAAPVERCVALTARGGVATRLEVSGSVEGPLAGRLRMEVAGGSSPAPGAGHGCAAFAQEQTLWSGTLADFPTDGTPVVSEGPLPADRSRTFRFRVWLPADAVVSASDTASQDIRWRAELEPPAEPPAPPPPTPPGGDRQRQSLDQPIRCRGTIRCRGRLIVRMTTRGARLHARVHAPGGERIRRFSLILPAALPASRARIAVQRLRPRGTVVELTGSVRVHPRVRQRLLTIDRLPARTRTVLMRVRVPRSARAVLVRAACRRAPVQARLTTSVGPRRLLARMWIARSSCR